MKKFDPIAVLAGGAIIFEDGTMAHIDSIRKGNTPFCVKTDEGYKFYDVEGKGYHQRLYMAPKKKQAWFNHYKGKDGLYLGGPHDTEEEAKSRNSTASSDYFGTFLHTWEE